MTDTNGFIEEGYKVPTTSGYMKLQLGANTFRILGSFIEKTAIRGMEYWKTKEGKRYPVRVVEGTPIQIEEIELNPKTGEPDMPKYFWSMPVWNYADKRIQILHLTQKTIIGAIKSLAENAKWGNPAQYDICVTKGEENGKTTYSVMPEPKAELAQEVVEAYLRTPINIQALFANEDPFAPVSKVEKKGAK